MPLYLLFYQANLLAEASYPSRSIFYALCVVLLMMVLSENICLEKTSLREKLQNVSQHENAGGDIADMNFVRLREMPCLQL